MTHFQSKYGIKIRWHTSEAARGGRFWFQTHQARDSLVGCHLIKAHQEQSELAAYQPEMTKLSPKIQQSSVSFQVAASMPAVLL